MEQEQPPELLSKDTGGVALQEPPQQEGALAALALLFGPETSYRARVRATQRLGRLGPSVLPLILTSLNKHPEITTPAWPWWPPQYEHFSRLLLRLSESAHLTLDALLRHPAVSQPPGPVLWISVIEAASLLSHAGYEPFLSQGLTVPWMTVRYAAAMALANLGEHATLLPSTLEALRVHQGPEEFIPVQLASAYALLGQGDADGIEAPIRLLRCQASEEARKAAAFVLAVAFQHSERATSLSTPQRERLTRLLITALQDENEEVVTHAACALGNIASASALAPLRTLLDSSPEEMQLAALAALEEMANRPAVRRSILQSVFPGRLVALLRSESPYIRRQACYTLASFGGEYASAALGTTLLDADHPGHIEAIEGVRLLRGALRASIRTKIVRWLLETLRQPQEEEQVTALDSLCYLAWQACSQKRAWRDISNIILLDGITEQLLDSPGAWVRQRTVELLGMLHTPLPARLLHLLHTDNDSGVRACIAYTLGQARARWAIPALIQALLDPDDNVAETALNALGTLATADDTIVFYVMKELAGCRGKRETNRLAQPAQTLLRKWRRGGVMGCQGRPRPGPDQSRPHEKNG